MWAVFVDKVKEPNGASMIADHEDTSDPHALYAASHDHYTNSQVAVLRANVLRTELVSSTIPASHTLTMHYILIFSAKVHEYNKMVKLHNLMDTAQQLTHFKNYIHSVSKLDQTSTAIDILSADKALDPSATLNVSTMQRPGTHLVVISVRPSNPKPFLQM